MATLGLFCRYQLVLTICYYFGVKNLTPKNRFLKAGGNFPARKAILSSFVFKTEKEVPLTLLYK